MERPNHDLQAVAAGSKEGRAVSLAITIAIQVAVVLALVAGLASSQLKKELLAINASVERPKVIPKAPPPPPPNLVRPPPVTTVVPQFAIEAPPPPAAPAPVKAAPPAPPRVEAPTELKAITRTHTLPPYPTISQRLGEQGTSQLEISINIQGNVTTCKISKSSGSQRLDTAACGYVKDHWRWQPPTKAGKAVSATTMVDVVWNLKNAQ
ncbi:MAG: energy transducer TonB [Rhizomicrobium sp.]